MLLVFFIKPWHRIIYVTNYFIGTPVEAYRYDPLLKSNRFRKEVKFNLPVLSNENKKNNGKDWVGENNDWEDCCLLIEDQVEILRFYLSPVEKFRIKNLLSFSNKIYIFLRNLRL